MIVYMGMMLTTGMVAVLAVWLYRSILATGDMEDEVVSLSPNQRTARPERQRGYLGAASSKTKGAAMKRERSTRTTSTRGEPRKILRKKSKASQDGVRRPWGW